MVLGALGAMGCSLVKTEVVKVSGGEAISVEVEHEWPPTGHGGILYLPAEGGAIRITSVGVFLNAKRKLVAVFAFRVKNGGTLNSVLIEDVTDNQAEVLVDDSGPKLDKGDWSASVDLKPITGSCPQWLLSSKESIRIYRFSIAAAKAEKLVIYQAVTYNSRYKEFLVRNLR